jgi:predicted metalloprotease with PDZ domain
LEMKTVERTRPVLGFSVVRDEMGALVVQSVAPEGAAAQAGLHTNDVILTWNGGEPPRNPERWVDRQNRNSALHLSVRREEQKTNLEFRLSEISETGYAIAESAQPSEKARRIREGLLRGTTQPVTAVVP